MYPKRAVFPFFLLFMILPLTSGQKRDLTVVKRYVEADYLTERDSLQHLYGINKTIPPEFDLQILLALSHYPELRTVRMQFVPDRHAVIPLSSRPQFFSMLRKKEKWVYKVVISEKPMSTGAGSMFRSLPFNAQVGIIGHELAHTVYYQELSFWQVVWIGLRYPSGKFRARFERNTDRRAINYGLGWQLLDFAVYTSEKMENRSEKMAEYMSRFYLTPGEIREQMDATGLY